MDEKEIAVRAAKVGANMVGAAVSISTGNPIAGAAVGGLLNNAIDEYDKRVLSPRQRSRVQRTLDMARQDVEEKQKVGTFVERNDSFFELREADVSDAGKLLEETLYKCTDEFEERKLVHYAKLYSNICFRNDITYEYGYVLLRLARELSYRQMAILAYMADGYEIDMNEWDKVFKANKDIQKYYDFYVECQSLYRWRLTCQPNDYQGIQLGDTPRTVISTMGKDLHDLMELNTIDTTDVRSVLDAINALVVADR